MILESLQAVACCFIFFFSFAKLVCEQIWDIERSETCSTLSGHEGNVCDLALVSGSALSPSLDSPVIASASHDNTVALWDVRCSKCVNVLKGDFSLSIPADLCSFTLSSFYPSVSFLACSCGSKVMVMESQLFSPWVDRVFWVVLGMLPFAPGTFECWNRSLHINLSFLFLFFLHLFSMLCSGISHSHGWRGENRNHSFCLSFYSKFSISFFFPVSLDLWSGSSPCPEQCPSPQLLCRSCSWSRCGWSAFSSWRSCCLGDWQGLIDLLLHLPACHYSDALVFLFSIVSSSSGRNGNTWMLRNRLLLSIPLVVVFWPSMYRYPLWLDHQVVEDWRPATLTLVNSVSYRNRKKTVLNVFCDQEISRISPPINKPTSAKKETVQGKRAKDGIVSLLHEKKKRREWRAGIDLTRDWMLKSKAKTRLSNKRTAGRQSEAIENHSRMTCHKMSMMENESSVNLWLLHWLESNQR